MPTHSRPRSAPFARFGRSWLVSIAALLLGCFQTVTAQTPPTEYVVRAPGIAEQGVISASFQTATTTVRAPASTGTSLANGRMVFPTSLLGGQTLTSLSLTLNWTKDGVGLFSPDPTLIPTASAGGRLIPGTYPLYGAATPAGGGPWVYSTRDQQGSVTVEADGATVTITKLPALPGASFSLTSTVTASGTMRFRPRDPANQTANTVSIAPGSKAVIAFVGASAVPDALEFAGNFTLPNETTAAGMFASIPVNRTTMTLAPGPRTLSGTVGGVALTDGLIMVSLDGKAMELVSMPKRATADGTTSPLGTTVTFTLVTALTPPAGFGFFGGWKMTGVAYNGTFQTMPLRRALPLPLRVTNFYDINYAEVRFEQVATTGAEFLRGVAVLPITKELLTPGEYSLDATYQPADAAAPAVPAIAGRVRVEADRKTVTVITAPARPAPPPQLPSATFAMRLAAAAPSGAAPSMKLTIGGTKNVPVSAAAPLTAGSTLSLKVSDIVDISSALVELTYGATTPQAGSLTASALLPITAKDNLTPGIYPIAAKFTGVDANGQPVAPVDAVPGSLTVESDRLTITLATLPVPPAPPPPLLRSATFAMKLAAAAPSGTAPTMKLTIGGTKNAPVSATAPMTAGSSLTLKLDDIVDISSSLVELTYGATAPLTGTLSASAVLPITAKDNLTPGIYPIAAKFNGTWPDGKPASMVDAVAGSLTVEPDRLTITLTKLPTPPAPPAPPPPTTPIVAPVTITAYGPSSPPASSTLVLLAYTSAKATFKTATGTLAAPLSLALGDAAKVAGGSLQVRVTFPVPGGSCTATTTRNLDAKGKLTPGTFPLPGTLPGAKAATTAGSISVAADGKTITILALPK